MTADDDEFFTRKCFACQHYTMDSCAYRLPGWPAVGPRCASYIRLEAGTDEAEHEYEQTGRAE